jgi:hypothetical protein
MPQEAIVTPRGTVTTGTVGGGMDSGEVLLLPPRLTPTLPVSVPVNEVVIVGSAGPVCE